MFGFTKQEKQEQMEMIYEALYDGFTVRRKPSAHKVSFEFSMGYFTRDAKETREPKDTRQMLKSLSAPLVQCHKI